MITKLSIQTVQWGATLPLDTLQAEFDHWLGDRSHRKPKRAFLEATHFTLRQVVLNLLSVEKGHPDSRLSVPGSKAWYRENRPILGPMITCASVRRVVEFLRARGYVTWRQGTASKSVSFQSPNSIKASKRLLTLMKVTELPYHAISRDPSAAPLRLKAPKKDENHSVYVPVPNTTETSRMTANLGMINQVLGNHWPDLDVGYGREREVTRRMTARDGYDRYVDYGRRTLYRVFNNGTLADGGRFYGGWWQDIPKDYRPYITIDGQPTVEVDYAAMQPTILYHEVDLAKPADPYDIGFGSREVVKRTVNALINAKGTSIHPVEGYSEAETGMPWGDFLKAVREHFSVFEPYFGTGYGLKLQRLDSDIAENVMLHFARKDIAVLPLHDSFIVDRRHEIELAQIMEQAFFDKTGAKVNLKVATSGIDHRRKPPSAFSGVLVSYDRDAGVLGYPPYKRLADFRVSMRSTYAQAGAASAKTTFSLGWAEYAQAVEVSSYASRRRPQPREFMLEAAARLRPREALLCHSFRNRNSSTQ